MKEMNNKRNEEASSPLERTERRMQINCQAGKSFRGPSLAQGKRERSPDDQVGERFSGDQLNDSFPLYPTP